MHRGDFIRQYRCFVIAFGVFIVLCALSGCTKKESISTPGGKIVKDDNYHFELQIPATWEIRQADDPDSQNRLRAVSVGKKEINIYALRSALLIDHEKLADQSMKLLKGEGGLITTKHLPDSIFVPWLADANGSVRTFRNRDSFTLLFVEAVGPYGYIGVLKGPDDIELHNVITSFNAVVPIKETGYAYVNYISVFILACLLGESGFSFRKRFFKYKILKLVITNETASGKFKNERFKTAIMLCISPIWCLVLYLLGACFLEYAIRTIFIIVGPILPVLGYFGIIREPPDEI